MTTANPSQLKTPPPPSPIPKTAPEAPHRPSGERSEPVSCLGVKHDDGDRSHRRRAPLPGALRTTRTDDATEQCGTFKSAYKCASLDGEDRSRDGDHDRYATVFTCNNQSCEEPACSRKWVNRRAPAAAARIIGSVYWHEGINADPVHVTLSPPVRDRAVLWGAFEVGTEYAMNRARREARRIAAAAGIRGGALVFHAHRCRHQNDAKGRYDTTPLTWSPHWHVVGGGWVVGVERIHAQTGWVVVNHGVRQDTQGTVAYLLDHCAWVSGGQAITYFGFATSKHTRVVELESVWELARCGGCGDTVTVHARGHDGHVDWDASLGERPLKVRVFLVHAAERNDKFPLEFRTSSDEFTYRMVKPPPGAHRDNAQTRLCNSASWACPWC